MSVGRREGTALRHSLSWSASRRRLFEDCRRAYYFSYYLSWRGWEEGAPAAVRRAYVLKQITNLDMLAGSAVHRALQVYFGDRRAGRRTGRELTLELALETMRAAWRESRAGGFERDPKRNARLFEHHYGVEIPAARTEALKAKVVRCVARFFEDPAFEDLREADPEAVVLCEEREAFPLGEWEVFAVPDLVVRRGEGLFLVDWKTGRPWRGDDLQLQTYALYARHRFGLAADRLRAAAAYLGEGTLAETPVTDGDLARAREEILRSLAAMAEVHFDPDEGEGDPEGFPMNGYPRLCPRCNFRELCGF